MEGEPHYRLRGKRPAGERVRAAVEKFEGTGSASHAADEIERHLQGQAMQEQVLSVTAEGDALMAEPLECLFTPVKKKGAELNFRKLEGEHRKKHEAATEKEWATITASKAIEIVSEEENAKIP